MCTIVIVRILCMMCLKFAIHILLIKENNAEKWSEHIYTVYKVLMRRLQEGHIGRCEILNSSRSTCKLPTGLQLDLFDLCTPREMSPTRHCVEFGLQCRDIATETV